MRRFQLDITLREELVMSARSATVGGNHSLNYIPGAALLGAAAAQLYHRSGQEQAFRLFHSGYVRFGNALPVLPEGERGKPMPFAWHAEKGAVIYQTDHRECLDATKINNYCLEQQDPALKRVQLRSGFVTDSGYLLTPETRFRMKTAIDPDKARAATAQLFGYESLQSGQCFRAYLDVDRGVDDVLSDALLDELISALSGVLQMGRSRSAQYGEVECEVTEVTAPATPATFEQNELVIWLQSDMALLSETGHPVLLPETTHFGLPEGERIDSKTFIRTRSYSPYNSKRRCYDSAREVLEQGSVITFVFKESLSAAALEPLQNGVGAYREHGLGQVSLNDPLLMVAPPSPVPFAGSRISPAFDAASVPDHPLARWLSRNVSGAAGKLEIRQLADLQAKQLDNMYEAARRFAGQPVGTLVGPGTTQWGRVAEVAKAQVNAPTPAGLMKALFGGDDTQAICKRGKPAQPAKDGKPGKPAKPDDPVWFAETGLEGDQSSFGGWLEAILTAQGDEAALLASYLSQIARAIVKEKEGRT